MELPAFLLTVYFRSCLLLFVFNFLFAFFFKVVVVNCCTRHLVAPLIFVRINCGNSIQPLHLAHILNVFVYLRFIYIYICFFKFLHPLDFLWRSSVVLSALRVMFMTCSLSRWPLPFGAVLCCL